MALMLRNISDSGRAWKPRKNRQCVYLSVYPTRMIRKINTWNGQVEKLTWGGGGRVGIREPEPERGINSEIIKQELLGAGIQQGSM